VVSLYGLNEIARGLTSMVEAEIEVEELEIELEEEGSIEITL